MYFRVIRIFNALYIYVCLCVCARACIFLKSIRYIYFGKTVLLKIKTYVENTN